MSPSWVQLSLTCSVGMGPNCDFPHLRNRQCRFTKLFLVIPYIQQMPVSPRIQNCRWNGETTGYKRCKRRSVEPAAHTPRPMIPLPHSYWLWVSSAPRRSHFCIKALKWRNYLLLRMFPYLTDEWKLTVFPTRHRPKRFQQIDFQKIKLTN